MHTDAECERMIEERDDRVWYPVYAAVLLFAVLVISALWAFSRYFSS
jgi:hypothetical protein